ncbi:hypothetical protein F2Q68_00019294, partial [Brassica cretica]
ESKILKFLGFMWNPLSWVMEAAAIMAIALANGDGRPPDWQDFVGIICLLVINSTISFIEENNAGNAAAALMAGLAPKTKARAGIREVHFLPFNPVDKRTALTYIDSDGNWHRVSKGAPEQILDLANARPDLRKKVFGCMDKYAERGLRSLAVARQLLMFLIAEHKYEIVKKLQERKHIVGMTGDGVNDAPALKKADIGIAVADATDAARGASDIVLTEPGLSVIISAVLTSRAIFQRMKNYTIYAVSITIRIVFGFMLIALIWEFDFSAFMVLIIAILNDGTIMTISKDRVKPSPTPDSWKLREIFATGIVLGGYQAVMSVIFFWAIHKTDFFSDKFGVRSIRDNNDELMGFPSGDIGKVSLSYDGLHRYCFTCNLISHDENTCPLLAPEERELKRKLRQENLENNEWARFPIQGSQGFNSRNPLKRARSPTNGRHPSPSETTRYSELNHRKSSSRQENHYTHHGREVWSRLENPARKKELQGSLRGRTTKHSERNIFRKETSRPSHKPYAEWRPRSFSGEHRNRSGNYLAPRRTEDERMERSRATFDSQKTITDNRVSLESGEIFETHRSDFDAAMAEEERICHLKGKAIATGPPSPTHKTPRPLIRANQGIILTSPVKPTDAPQVQRYDQPLLEQEDAILELEEGLDQALDVPLTELESTEVDNLVLETERLEMAEKMMA